MLREFFPADRGFLFLDKGKPDFAGKPRQSLYDALAIMGIDRKGKNISFHSWRHWFNSKLVRANINSSKIKMVIGHTEKGNDMTSLYTHFFAEDFADVVRIQEELLESFKGEQSA
jgi:integrase